MTFTLSWVPNWRLDIPLVPRCQGPDWGPSPRVPHPRQELLIQMPDGRVVQWTI